MASPRLNEQLLALVPPLAVRLLLAEKCDTSHPRKGRSTHLCGAVLLFIDISGFTPLSERFCESGLEGAHEALETLLRLYFSRINAVVEAHGGETCKYAGDALLCVFEDTSSPGVDHRSSAALVRAVAVGCRVAAIDFDCCSPVVADALFSLGLPIQLVSGLRLRCKSIVCSPGLLEVALIGGGGADGTARRRELVLLGDPLSQLGLLSNHALVGCCIFPTSALVTSCRAIEELRPEPLPLPGFVRADCAQLARAPDDTSPLPEASSRAESSARPLAASDLASLCIEPVGTRLQAGLSLDIMELRTCTVIFALLDLARVSSSDVVWDADLVGRFDAACRSFQRAILPHGGALRQAIQDDKGVVVIGVFGLPTMATASSALAACCAAAAFQVSEYAHQGELATEACLPLVDRDRSPRSSRAGPGARGRRSGHLHGTRLCRSSGRSAPGRDRCAWRHS